MAKKILIVTAAVFFLFACSPRKRGDNEKPIVTVSIIPQKTFFETEKWILTPQKPFSETGKWILTPQKTFSETGKRFLTPQTKNKPHFINL